MAVIKCPNCGANNLDTGKGVRCEYCSSYLETLTPEPVIKEKNPNVFSIPIPNFSELPVIGKFFKPQQPQNTSAGAYDPWADTATNKSQKRFVRAAPAVKKDFSVEPASSSTSSRKNHKNFRIFFGIAFAIIAVILFIAVPTFIMREDVAPHKVVVSDIGMESRIVNIKNEVITYEIEMEFAVNNKYDYSKDVSITYEVYSYNHCVATLTFTQSVKSGKSKLVVKKNLTNIEKPTNIKLIKVIYN